MTGIASQSQLRMSFVRNALVTVPAMLLLGTLSSALSGNGSGDPWYERLAKPDFMPPGWVFALAWPLLYILLGLVLAMIMHARGARGREKALALFWIQLAANLVWSPVFFIWRDPSTALMILAALVIMNAALVALAWRVRPVAALLLLPYFGWLIFAAALNFEIVAMNPDASRVAPSGATTDIQL